MTDRLYYNDPYRRDFEATVVKVDSQGGRTEVWLDRTAFYPTSGGQSFDTGTLAGLPVVDVSDEDGDVKHVVEGALPIGVGEPVRGAIDWPRRCDHMQQHTGQHILSAAFVRRFDAATVSVHLGSDTSTIDLKRELAPAEIAAAEDDANRIIWENRPIAIRYASADEAAALGLRKPSARAGTLRLIDIEQWDLSACGGTHVASTAGVGIVVVASWERFKGGQRLEFLCGGRALTAFRRLRDSNLASVRLLSATPDSVAAAIERLQTELRDQSRAMKELESGLAAELAQRFAGEAEAFAGGAAIVRVVPGSALMLKEISSALAARSRTVVVLVSADAPVRVVAARSVDATASCAAIVSALTGEFGGRGGGKPDLAQAGGLQGDPQAIAARASVLVTQTSA